MANPRFVVEIVRVLTQRTNDNIVKKQVDFIINRALGSSRGNCWKCDYELMPCLRLQTGWSFRVQLIFTKVSGHERSTEKQWANIYLYLDKVCNNSKWGNFPWKIDEEETTIIEDDSSDDNTIPVNSTIIPVNPINQPNVLTEKGYGEINLEISDHFEGIYDREAQIEIVYSSLTTAKQTELTKRFHCILYGLPGCGKTEILERFSRMIGNEMENYFKLDATSTTAAGAMKLLLDATNIPPVLIIEEIEKADEKTLHWLLGVLDDRAEIRKTNYRVRHVFRHVPMLCLATVNDIDLFNKMMSGALASRFPHKIYCPRPNRDVLQLILEREVKEIDGNQDWIKPTLDFCHDVFGWTDPRTLIPICLCGKDKLLDNSYQKALLKTFDPSLLKENKLELKKWAKENNAILQDNL